MSASEWCWRLVGVQHIVPCWQAPAWDRAPAAEPARSSRQLEQLAQLGVGGTRSSPSTGGARRRAAGAVLVHVASRAARDPRSPCAGCRAPGVLVAEIADLLREREAERREPLDQPREFLLVQRLQIAGLRLFGGGIRLVVGVVGAGDALAPTPRGAVAP